MGAVPQQGLTLILGRARAGDERARGEALAQPPWRATSSRH